MHTTHDSTEISIAQYLEVLRRRWFWIVIAPVVLVGFTLFTDLRATPVYQAQAELLLQNTPTANVLTNTVQTVDPARALQNELRIIRSRTVKLAVAEEYGSPVSVSALAGGEDDIIILAASASTGEEAARRVNVYAETYQTARLDALVEDLAQTRKVVEQQVADFQAEVDAIDAPLAALDAQIASTSPDAPGYAELVQDRERTKNRTDAARTDAQDRLNEYRERLQVLDLSQRLTTSSGIQILNPAAVPGTPVSPTPVRNAIQALIVGAFIGLALAFGRDQLDDSLRTKADVERAIKDLPTLAMVPDDSNARDPRSDQLTTQAAPMSATAESYRGLRTSIQYASLDRDVKVVQVTSASASEGKTTTLSNLAVAFAQSGKRVVVVGCDLRRPRLHQTMDVDGTIGFTSVVLGYLTLTEAIQSSPLHPNVDVLASGPLPPNPSELLNHDRTASIIRSLADEYSMVLIDCPPVLPVTDSLVLSRCVDSTIFVVRANQTTRRTARRAVEMLGQVGSPLLGLVINGVAGEDTYGSFYEYYGYTKRSSVPLFGRFFGRRTYTLPTAEDALPADEDDGAGGSKEPAEPAT